MDKFRNSVKVCFKRFVKFIFTNATFNDGISKLLAFIAIVIIADFFIFVILISILILIYMCISGKGNETLKTIFYAILNTVLQPNCLIPICIYILVVFFLSTNFRIIKTKNYKEEFSKETNETIKVYIRILIGILVAVKSILCWNKYALIKQIWVYMSMFCIFIALTWILYFSFCVRVLNSINVRCSIFIAKAFKSILIALVAWFTIYKSVKTTIDYSINLTTSALSFLYPILDMYVYVCSEIEEFSKK